MAAPFLFPGGAPAAGIAVEPDLFMGVWSPFGSRWERTSPLCLWSDRAGQPYRIRVSGLTSKSRFELDGGGDARLRYRVILLADGNNSKRERLRPDKPSKQTIRASASTSCAGVPNARVRLRISNADLQSAPPAVYRDSLLFMVSPL